MKLVKNLFFVAAALVSSLLFLSSQAEAQTAKKTKSPAAGSGGYTKIPTGVEYKIVKSGGTGITPKIGDVLEMNIRLKVTNKGRKDTILGESSKMNNGKPVAIPLQPSRQYDWTSALYMLSKGDSAIVRISADSLIKAYPSQIPAFMKKGGYEVYEVRIVNIKSQAEVEKETKEHAKVQLETDDKLLQAYFAKNNIKPQKTASGLYYTIQKEGTGNTIQKGQTATVNYTGKTMNGKTFDSNQDPQFNHVQPFSFPVGEGRVIKGWDEGLALLKKDAKATLYIPSPMAYGEKAPPNIGPNAILIFDIEVTDVTSETK